LRVYGLDPGVYVRAWGLRRNVHIYGMARCSGSRLSTSGFGVWNLGFRVQGAGSGVNGYGFGIQGFEATGRMMKWCSCLIDTCGGSIAYRSTFDGQN